VPGKTKNSLALIVKCGISNCHICVASVISRSGVEDKE
jgi:hypothetical protein